MAIDYKQEVVVPEIPRSSLNEQLKARMFFNWNSDCRCSLTRLKNYCFTKKKIIMSQLEKKLKSLIDQVELFELTKDGVVVLIKNLMERYQISPADICSEKKKAFLLSQPQKHLFK